MESITINVVSTETIKPRHRHLIEQPFQLSLLDQVAPLTYVPFIFFYSKVQNDQNTPDFVNRFRASLSEALTRFHPLSGRLANDGLSVVDFDRGVPFRNALVNCRMSEFLRNRDGAVMSCLNRFLPFRPFCNEKSKSKEDTDMPLLAVQVNKFLCGGVAVGVSVHHTVADAATSASFLDSWAAITRGESPAVDGIDLDLCGRSLRVPSVASVETHMHDKIWSCRGNLRTERFVFDEVALAALKSKGRSDVVSNPTRVQAVSGLIWKSAMAASRTVSSGSSSDIYVMCHTVNMRPHKHNNGPTTGTAMGNLFLYTGAVYNNDRTTTAGDPSLPKLIELVSESISKVNNDHARSVRGSEAVDFVVGNLKALESVLSYEDAEMTAVTSWVNMGLKGVDFGLRKPVWVGVWGRGGPELTNGIILNDATWCRGIEAWVNLDEKVLEFMRNDPEFLEFAVVDPPIPFQEI